MNPAAYTAIGAVGGALIAAIATLLVSAAQRRSDRIRYAHQRATGEHAEAYRLIYECARSAQESVQTLLRISRKRDAGSIPSPDPVLETVLAVAIADCKKFCDIADWHSHDMMQIDLRIEKAATVARRLMIRWVDVPRISYRPLVQVVIDGRSQPIVRGELKRRDPTSYSHISSVRQRTLTVDRNDRRNAEQIDKALDHLVSDIKALVS